MSERPKATADRTESLARRRAKRQGRKRGCPICGKPPVPEYQPFCSARCKQIDLGRWLGETYRIPSAERVSGEPPVEEEPEPPPRRRS